LQNCTHLGSAQLVPAFAKRYDFSAGLLDYPESMKQFLQNSTLLRYILLVACGWLTVLILNYFYTTVAVFAAAGIFAALLNYPVLWLSRYLPRGLAIALTFIVTLALLLGLVSLVGLQVLSQGQSLLRELGNGLSQQNVPQEFLNQLDLNSMIGTVRSGLVTGLEILRSVSSSLFLTIFGAVIALYMLIDGSKLWQSLLKRLPANSRDRFDRIFRQSVLGFIRGQLLLMLFLSGTTLLVYPLLGVNYALLLALIIGTIDAIPGIGATLGTIVVTFLIFASQGGAVALRALIASLVLLQIQDNYVRPKVMGDALSLNPVLLFLALFIGERVAGLLGIFLAIPIAGMITLWMQPSDEPASDPEQGLEDQPDQG
jgi:predicted PurR-regulated permease PerM